jgi:cell division septation protein DedD
MNELLRRRLVGLAVLLLGLFLLSWFVPGGDGRGVEPGTPSTLVALGPGAATELTAGADAAHEVPSTPEPEPTAAASSAPPIADLTGDTKPAPGPARAEPASKPVPKVSSEAPAESRKPVPVAKLAPQKAEPAKPVVAEKPAMAQTGWWIQIGSYSDHSKAETILSLLRKIGHRGELTTIQGKKGLLNRVRLGPYPNEAAARKALPKVAHQGYPQAQVVFER